MKLIFTWLLHATALMALAHLYSGVEITSFGAALLGSLIYSAFGVVIDSALERLFPTELL